MAQSALVNKDQELNLPINMSITKEELMVMAPEDIFEWEVTKVIHRIRNRAYKIQMEDGKITYRNRGRIRARANF